MINIDKLLAALRIAGEENRRPTGDKDLDDVVEGILDGKLIVVPGEAGDPPRIQACG